MYEKNKPLYPFGYGLTYTNFAYSDLKADKNTIKEDDIVNLKFDLKNTGNYDSDEVAQLYVSFPDSKVDRPRIALKGFKRVFVAKGGSVHVSLALKASDLTYWDIAKQAFVLEKGKIKFFIGASSDDSKLQGELLVK
jgi:beta-glucosidase